MKRNIVFLAGLAILSVALVWAQDPKGKESIPLGLKQKIVSEYEIIDSSEGPSRNVLRSKWGIKYSRDGQLTEELYFNLETGQLASKDVYKYDAKGHMVEKTHLAGNEKPHRRETFAYDDHGKEVEYAFYDEEGQLRTKRTRQYDKNGSLIEEDTRYKKFATIDLPKVPPRDEKKSWCYRYDAKGNMIEKKLLTPDEAIKGRGMETYRYDENGRPVEITLCTSDGTPYWRKTDTYDSKGNKIEEAIDGGVAKGDSYSKTTFQYDERGNLMEEKISHSSGDPSKKTYRYDDKGNLTKESEYHKDQLYQTHYYRYTYNDAGQVVEKNGYRLNTHELGREMKIHEAQTLVEYEFHEKK